MSIILKKKYSFYLTSFKIYDIIIIVKELGYNFAELYLQSKIRLTLPLEERNSVCRVSALQAEGRQFKSDRSYHYAGIV